MDQYIIDFLNDFELSFMPNTKALLNLSVFFDNINDIDNSDIGLKNKFLMMHEDNRLVELIKMESETKGFKIDSISDLNLNHVPITKSLLINQFKWENNEAMITDENLYAELNNLHKAGNLIYLFSAEWTYSELRNKAESSSTEVPREELPDSYLAHFMFYHRVYIVLETLQNKNRSDYVSLKLDKDCELVDGSLHFIEDEIDESDFEFTNCSMLLHEPEPCSGIIPLYFHIQSDYFRIDKKIKDYFISCCKIQEKTHFHVKIN